LRAQRGIALITAIILVALAAVLATAIGFSSAMAARRASTMFGADQSFLAAEGVEAMAAYVLNLTTTNNATASINLSGNSHWADPYGPYELADGISLDLAQIEDEQGKFNINNLAPNGTVNPDDVQAFQRLLQKVSDTTGVTVEQKWADLILDWIDTDNEPTSPDGAEDSVYLSQTPQYRTANLPVTSISELLALPGFGRARYDALAPYITALPPGNPINICTASGVVLDALAGTTSWSLDPNSLATERKEAKDCFPSLTAYQSTLTGDGKSASGLIGTTSAYFRLRSFITIGSAHFTLYSLLYRDANSHARAILRTFGTE
jgi:general secretion pathway protein K